MPARPTALIADDEPLLREALAGQLAQVWPELDVIAQARNGREAVEKSAWFKKGPSRVTVGIPRLWIERR